MRNQQRLVVVSVVTLVASALMQGCLQRELAPINPCLVSVVTATEQINTVDKIDLLFMIDNSSSMEDKQRNLRQAVPRLVQALATGKRSATDPAPFPPVHDMHIAVVTSDMGLVGVPNVPAAWGCSTFGQDGVFQHTPHASPESPTCDASYPTFLSYTAGADTPAKLAQDFGCIANVGAMGCGFEQQLESTLKALWPSHYADPTTGEIVSKNPYLFLTDKMDPMEAFGHGDGVNAGFLRDATTDPSILVIVVLSDEDDGSTPEMALYTPFARPELAPSWLEPVTFSNLNLRPLIGNNTAHLYPISRYAQAFQALRPNSPQLLVYAAITGVPSSLVDAQATAGVDFSNQAPRDAFYDRILSDPSMQNVIDPDSPADNRSVKYACNTPFGHATPGRRYIELAKALGENASVYSICDADYTPAMNHLIDIIAKQLTSVCLPKPLVRDERGNVSCNVVWELPAPNEPHSSQAPTACSDRPLYLSTPGAGHATSTRSGRAICTVQQLPVTSTSIPTGDGWYYDDFSTALAGVCPKAQPQRVAFSDSAKPPRGVTVTLECLNEIQPIVDARTDVVPGSVFPTLGTSCETISAGNADGGAATSAPSRTNASSTALAATATPVSDPDELCAVHLASGAVDRQLFCDPKTNTCVRACQADPQCPPAWVCDNRLTTLASTISATRPTGSGYCVNPTCGTQE